MTSPRLVRQTMTGDRQVDDLAKQANESFRGIASDIDEATITNAVVSSDATVSKRVRSYYVDLRTQAVRLKLPEDPFTCERHTFKDIYGQAATRNLTIDGGSLLLEQIGAPSTRASTIVVSTAGASVIVEFNGTFWSIV